MTRGRAKRMRKLFRINDVVTWGFERTKHRVASVTHSGLFVADFRPVVGLCLYFVPFTALNLRRVYRPRVSCST